MKHFPGVSAPYEAPLNPDLVLPTDQWPVAKCVDALVKLLADRGAI
jgi:adenylylsulfate kinase-like enzyme